jgi:hypothetical protein
MKRTLYPIISCQLENLQDKNLIGYTNSPEKGLWGEIALLRGKKRAAEKEIFCGPEEKR